MKILLTDRDLCDVELQGTDQVLVPANRGMLGARSKVFRTMLFGKFAEANSSTIALGYPGAVLRSVVEYICTNQCEVLQDTDDCQPRTLVALADAAQYFGFPKLSRQAQRAARSWMERKPSLACLFLVECRGTGLEDWARQMIRSKPTETFLSDDDREAVASLSPALLESILRDGQMEADEYTLFRILKAWADMDDYCIETDTDGDDETSNASPETRQEIATRLTEHIRLEGINPPDLATFVAPSGLVSAEQLSKAFQVQALRAYKEHAVNYLKPRYVPPVWESSQLSVLASRSVVSEVELLQCAAMTCGIHKWTIQIETLSGSMALGVASTIYPPDPEEALGCDGGGWALWQSGEVCHGLAGDEVDLHFGEGSTISLIMDLREERGGTLSALVDDGPVLLLFSDMLSHLEGNDKGGFVPALSMYAQGRIRLLEMHEISSY